MAVTTSRLFGIGLAAKMAMNDEILPLPTQREVVEKESGQVFEVGDRTVELIRDQVFAFDEYGTYGPGNRRPAIEVAVEVPGENTLNRVERKIDVAMRGIAALQRRIESIDRVLARLISRARKNCALAGSAIRPRDRRTPRGEVAETLYILERLEHRAPKLGREIDLAFGAVFELHPDHVVANVAGINEVYIDPSSC
jgi:hypothetical protein